MKRINIITLGLCLVVLSALAFVGVASAQSFKTGNSISVPASETIDSMLFTAGGNINIAGTVNGDVYCAGQTVTISGTIKGDVFCAGQTIIISGKIEGDIRIGGQSVTLSSSVGGSATIGTQNLIIDKTATINRDLLGGSQNITLNGIVGRDVIAGGQDLTINGNIGRNFRGETMSLTVGSSGKIGGNVDLISNNDPVVNDGGKIVGTVKRTAPKKQQDMEAFSPVVFTFGWFVYSFIALMIVALVLVGLFPRILREATEKAMKKPGYAILTGFLTAIIVPALVIALLVSVIGIPLAILIMLLWFVVMIISTPFAGYMLGRILQPKSKQPVWIMALGTGILIITYFIPFVGFITMLTAYLFGTGMIITQSKQLMAR